MVINFQGVSEEGGKTLSFLKNEGSFDKICHTLFCTLRRNLKT